MPTVTDLVWTAAACLLVGCGVESSDPGADYESEWLQIHVGEGDALCAGSAAEFETHAAAARQVTGLTAAPVAIYFGATEVDEICGNDVDGCFDELHGHGAAVSNNFTHEYVHGLQAGIAMPPPFWAEGGAQLFSGLAEQAVSVSSLPADVIGDPENQPLNLRDLAQPEFLAKDWSYRVADHFFHFLAAEHGVETVAEFHDRVRDEDDEQVFVEVFGETFMEANDRWIADAELEYELPGLGVAPVHCESYVELPYSVSSTLSCEDATTLGQLDNGFIRQGIIDQRRPCFVLEEPAEIVIDFADSVPDTFALYLVRGDDCAGPASPEAYQSLSYGTGFDGVPIELAGCEWRVQPRTLSGHEATAYDFTIRVAD